MSIYHKITPHLWFDKEAYEAVKFYSSVFPNFKTTAEVTLDGVPSPTGDTNIINFQIDDQPFIAINAGPDFKPNPSISFFVNFDPSKDPNAEQNLQNLWDKMIVGGEALMELSEYPFSKKYGWVADKFGVTWQLMLTDPKGELRPFIIPSLLFTQDVAGKAEEAINFYRDVFTDAKLGTIARYPKGMEPDKEGTIMFSEIFMHNTWVVAMDSAHDHKFKFSEGISLLVPCDTQEEIDYYWNKLSAVPEAEQCGWLKDKFGVSWQISPTNIDKLMAEGTPEQRDRVVKAFLQMKKFNLAELDKAFKG